MLFVRLDSRSLFRMSFVRPVAFRDPGISAVSVHRGRLAVFSLAALGVLTTLETTRVRSWNLDRPGICRLRAVVTFRHLSSPDLSPFVSQPSVRASHETIQPALVRGRSEPSESIGGHPVSCESYPELVSDASTCPPLFRHRAPLGIRSTETPEFLPIGMEF